VQRNGQSQGGSHRQPVTPGVSHRGG